MRVDKFYWESENFYKLRAAPSNTRLWNIFSSDCHLTAISLSLPLHYRFDQCSMFLVSELFSSFSICSLPRKPQPLICCSQKVQGPPETKCWKINSLRWYRYASPCNFKWLYWKNLVDDLAILNNIETLRKSCIGNVCTVIHWVDLFIQSSSRLKFYFQAQSDQYLAQWSFWKGDIGHNLHPHSSFSFMLNITGMLAKLFSKSWTQSSF